jgi:hypothetical protein
MVIKKIQPGIRSEKEDTKGSINMHKTDRLSTKIFDVSIYRKEA